MPSTRAGHTVGISWKAQRQDNALTPAAPITASVSTARRSTGPTYDVHLACEVGVVLSGLRRRIYEGVDRRVGAGQVWLSGPWEPHGHQVLRGPSQAVVMTFLPDFLWGEGVADAPWDRLFLDHSPETRVIPLTRAEGRAAKALALEVVEECQVRGSFYIEAARLALKKLLLPIVRKASMARAASSRSDFDRVRRVIHLVNDRLPGSILLRDACREAKLARSQFCAVFRRTTGVPFGEFVLRARIARAAHDLVTIDTKIMALAKHWGFTDQSHMHRVFRKFFQCTPGEYRQRNR